MQRKLVLGLVGLTLAVPALAGAAPALPPQLRGIWMNDDAQGRQQCKAYLAATLANKSKTGDHLVGAEVIGARQLHSYSEYGEGNFYVPLRIAALGRHKWRVKAAIGIDGQPEPGASGRAVITLAVTGGKLQWTMESIDGKPVANPGSQRYFRCSAVQPGIYRG